MTTTRTNVKLIGRKGLYHTANGWIVERDEAYPDLHIWLVGWPGHVTGTCSSIGEAKQLIADTEAAEMAAFRSHNPFVTEGS